jgi:phospholipid/cholesterol/gamma-HCH transport system substrate-binding protein
MSMDKQKKVGFTVLAALLCLLALALFVGRARFGHQGYRVSVLFNFVDSLKPEAPVLYGGGVRIGTVESITAERGKVKVTCLLEKGTRISRESLATINTTGILGEKYVQFDAADDSGPLLAEGAEISGIDPGSLDRTLLRVERLADALEPLLSDPKVMGGISGTLGSVSQAAAEVRDLVHQARPSIESTLADLRAASADLKAMGAEGHGLTQRAGRLLSDANEKSIQESLAHLHSSLEKLDKVMVKIDKKQGALGALANDDQVGDELRDILSDLKAHPWKLLWKK